MTLHPGSAVWIDHHEARIFRVGAAHVDESIVTAPEHHIHRHPKGRAGAHEHPDDKRHFFADVASVLEAAERILIVGPSTAKLHFLRYLHEQKSRLEPRIVGIETADHPTDRQLIAHIKRYFEDADRISCEGG